MEEKYKQLKPLQEEINKLFELIDRNKQIINPDRLIILNKLLSIFKQSEINSINDLFDANLNIKVDETLQRLTSLKKILMIFLELEKNLKEQKFLFKI